MIEPHEFRLGRRGQQPAEPERPLALPPPGWHTGLIQGVEEKTRVSKTPYWAWEIALLGLDHDHTIYYVTSLSQKAVWRIADLVEAVTGVTIIEGSFALDPYVLCGSTVQVKVVHVRYGAMSGPAEWASITEVRGAR